MQPPRLNSPQPRRLLRLGAVVGGLVYAALVLGNGLDRLAFSRPAIASRVPAPFATAALEARAEAALPANPRAAAVLAQQVVARAPIEPSSTALLGATREAVGDEAGAERAFLVAGQLGWRIPMTQTYWLEAALASGEMGVAAQRLDALLRLHPELLRIPAALAPFEDSPDGRAALVDRLVTRPPWLDWYTGEIDPVPAGVLARRAPLLMMLGDRGVVLGCAAIAPAVRQLVGAGLALQADALRHRHCPG